ncbi:unnamed protein product, partial [Ectocarpus fasciculatus]
MEAPQGADDVANRIVSVLRPPSLPDMAAIPTGALVLPRSYVERAGVQEVADGLTDPEDHRTPYAIVGMGGAGKSILAAAVVRKSSVREHFRGGIFWVRVGRGAKSSLLPHLQGLAREIGAAPTDAPHGVPPVLDSLEQVQQHLATVASMGNAPRLVVLDDVWEREVVDALLPLGLKVLVTTRDRSVVGVPTGYLMVGDMTEEEAMLLLLKTSMTVGRPGDAVRTQMTKVVALCGRLPLALAIVGSMPVVKGKGSTAGAWRKLIEECENVAWRMRARGECFTSVKVTLESSFDALSETLQAAVLKIAVLAAGAVATLEMLSNLWETEDMEGTREQAENLVSKCLLQDGDGGGYRVHDLVLDFVKMKIRAEEEMVEKVTALQAQFLGRLDVLKGYENSEHGAGNQGLFVLGALWRSVENLSGDSQLEVASYSASLGALESSEATVEVAGCFSSVGFLFNLQGKYLEAEPLYERVQAILEKCLGPDHPKVATALKNRGELSENQGKYDAAEPLYVRATAIFEKSFGRNHPKFASILTSRAELLLSQGKYTEADILLQEACVTLEMRLGHEHPDVASSLTCRANVLAAQGKFQEADPLLVRALEIQERTLGPDHPSLANSLCSRANLLQAQGKLEEADPLLVRALEIQERTLGTKHPSLADSLCSRASLLQAQ